MEAIKLEDLKYSIDRKNILTNISISIAQNKTLGIYGQSGSGKTTLLKLISGLLAPSSGKVLIFGKSPYEYSNNNRPTVTVWQSRALFPHLKVKENIEYGLRFRKMSLHEKKDSFDRVVTLLNIDSLLTRNISNLSGGEQQKVALARALIVKPKVLLLDEPFTGIDKVFKKNLRLNLKEILKQVDSTNILVSHDTEDIAFFSDNVAILEEGRFSQVSSIPLVYNNPSTTFIAKAFGNFNLIPGTVTDIKDGKAIIQTQLGNIEHPSNQYCNIGAKINIAIKYGDVSIMVNGHHGTGGIIKMVESKGYEVEIWVELATDLVFNLIFTQSNYDDLNKKLAGNKLVYLHWESNKALILPN